MPYITMSASPLLTKILGRKEETFAAKYVHISTIRVSPTNDGRQCQGSSIGLFLGWFETIYRCWPVKQNPGLILGSGSQAGLTEYKSAAQRLRLDLQSLEVRGPSETKTATYKTLLIDTVSDVLDLNLFWHMCCPTSY